jgi:O-antigen ligase
VASVSLEILLIAGVVVLGVVAGATFVSPGRGAIAVVVVCTLVSSNVAEKLSNLPRIGPTRVLLAAVLIGWLLRELASWALNGRFRLGEATRPARGLVAVLGLFLVWSILGTLVSIDPMKSAYSVADLLVYALAFLMFCRLARQPGWWPSMQSTLFGVTALICLFAFVEAATHYNPLLSLYPDQLEAMRGGLLRVRSVFYHPLALGCYLTLIFPFVLVAFVEAPGRGRKLALGVLLAMVLVTALLTVSRGPWLAIATQAVLLLAWMPEQRRQRALLRVALAGAVVALPVLVYLATSNESIAAVIDPHNSLRGGGVDESSSEYYRIALLQAVLNEMEGVRWALGFGPGTFHLAGVESVYDEHHHVLTAADSHFVRLLFEHGFVGLVLFVLAIALTLALAARELRHGVRRWRLPILASVAAVLGFCFENITVSMFANYSLGITFWLVAAMPMAAHRDAAPARLVAPARRVSRAAA